MPRCEITGTEGARVPVGRAQPKAPVVRPPCAGSARVEVSSLAPGAIVHVKVGAKTYRGMPPPVGTDFSVGVDPLPAAGSVEVTQELCGVMSPKTQVRISAHENVTTPVKITEPLLACARAVHVENAHDGAILQAFARSPGGADAPISDFVLALGTTATIEVEPFLRQQDQVSVKQWACTTTPTVSNRVVVGPHGAPPLPKIHEPLFPGTSVSVDGALLGALVEVELVEAETAVFIGAAIADATPALVGLTRTLRIGDRVRARQTMCEVRTRPGPEARVVRPPPQAPVLDQPGASAQNVPVRPTFKWHDPGAGSDGRADTFEIVVKKGTALVFSKTGLPAPSTQPPSDLAFSTAYMWMVRSHNASGASGWSVRGFSTGQAPPPPAPQLDSYDIPTQTLSGRGFLKNHSVSVRLSMVGSSVLNSYGVAVQDTRDVRVNATSDAQGNLKVVVSPQQVLPPLALSDIDGYLLGVAPGEVMHLSATDGRTNPQDLTGFLWSNTLHVKAP
jgi:hypothetical protein